VGIPFYAAVVSATKDNEVARLIKGIGLKACQFS
jgi:hypothetical protein